MKKIAMVLGLVLYAGTANAAYINMNAAGAEIPSTNGATKTTRTGSVSPTTTVSFAENATNCAIWNTSLPQDAAAAPTLKCRVDAITMTTETGVGIVWGASSVAYRNGAVFDPSAAWSADDSTVLGSSSGNRTANAVNNLVANTPALAVYDKSASGACSSSNCSGKYMQVRICRYGAHASDTYQGAVQVTAVQCEY